MIETLCHACHILVRIARAAGRNYSRGLHIETIKVRNHHLTCGHAYATQMVLLDSMLNMKHHGLSRWQFEHDLKAKEGKRTFHMEAVLFESLNIAPLYETLCINAKQ